MEFQSELWKKFRHEKPMSWPTVISSYKVRGPVRSSLFQTPFIQLLTQREILPIKKNTFLDHFDVYERQSQYFSLLHFKCGCRLGSKHCTYCLINPSTNININPFFIILSKFGVGWPNLRSCCPHNFFTRTIRNVLVFQDIFSTKLYIVRVALDIQLIIRTS